MSGVLLEGFCPAAPCAGGRTLWLIIGAVTAISPVLLFAFSSVITGGHGGPRAEDDDDVELTNKRGGNPSEPTV